jgi:hypothetical protein
MPIACSYTSILWNSRGIYDLIPHTIRPLQWSSQNGIGRSESTIYIFSALSISPLIANELFSRHNEENLCISVPDATRTFSRWTERGIS